MQTNHTWHWDKSSIWKKYHSTDARQRLISLIYKEILGIKKKDKHHPIKTESTICSQTIHIRTNPHGCKWKDAHVLCYSEKCQLKSPQLLAEKESPQMWVVSAFEKCNLVTFIRKFKNQIACDQDSHSEKLCLRNKSSNQLKAAFLMWQRSGNRVNGS